jgi:hypothetical protein
MTVFAESPEFADRNGFARILNLRGLLSTGVEIGTFRGGFAVQLLSEWNVKWLHCVDPYNCRCLPHDEPVRDIDLQWAIGRLQPYCERVRIWKMASVRAAELIPYQVEFVYIDGGHNYEDCDMDIKTWWPKLTPNGVMAGHDFSPQGFPGVVRAVKEFAAREGVTIVYLGHQCEFRDWWAYKVQPSNLLRVWSTTEVKV